MIDKIKSEDFIKAFGNGVGAKVENNVNSPIVIDCKYYLPCGRCDKKDGLCSQLEYLPIPKFVEDKTYTDIKEADNEQ